MFSEEQIKSIAPNPAAFNSGRKLSPKGKWTEFAKSERAIWGAIKGSGKNPYMVQIDTQSVAYKCSCPSRQFPCKHSIALMLLFTNEGDAFSTTEEPDWVKDWMDRREAKANKAVEKEPKEETPEDLERKEKQKQKTQDQRMMSVQAGVNELELWLKDLVRIGLLELPNKSSLEYEKVASRMVDAKASGLAGWVKSFRDIRFDDGDAWQKEASLIIAKLYLLIRTFKNYQNLDPLWQATIRNLVGWSQSSKELLADPEADTAKDQWLLAGQENEDIDDITVQRNWFIGCQTGRMALILNFSTRFSTFEYHFMPGTVMEAEFAFFPSVTPYRAAVKMQRSVEDALKSIPEMLESWDAAFERKTLLLEQNPWYNDMVMTMKNVRPGRQGKQWGVCDQHLKFVPVTEGFDMDKLLNWLVISGNKANNIAFVLRNNNILPLGIFQEDKYLLL